MQPQTLGLAPSFGFGDRLGLATPGHVEAMRRAGSGIRGIFPQQSIREMARTARTPVQVMGDALEALRVEHWADAFGADADHLKTPEDVDVTSAAGFTFFTIDPSGHVDPHADGYNESTLREKVAPIARDIPWIDKYRGQSIRLATGTNVELSEEACLRAAVKYGRAINAAVHLADHIRRVSQTAVRDFEIELSVDETEQPTTLAEHYIIADQCLKSGMKLVSLAPRYIGEFEKGVDYKGDLVKLEASLRDHAAIAELLGPYKLSLHSGSDKLSMYPAFARATRGRFHVKTAGTSYLEALRVVARHEPALYRRIIEFARGRYDTDKATYHVSATLQSAPEPSAIAAENGLERIYLEMWADVRPGRGFTNPGRQILHCTFGSVLTHPEFGPLVKEIVADHKDTYRDVLADHFARHLNALASGLE
jgi:tagaturonate epimerase